MTTEMFPEVAEESERVRRLVKEAADRERERMLSILRPLESAALEVLAIGTSGHVEGVDMRRESDPFVAALLRLGDARDAAAVEIEEVRS